MEWFYAVFALALAIIGGGTFALRRRQQDRGLLRVDDGERVHHSKQNLPLMVVWAPEMGGWLDSIRWCVDWWNEQVGTTVFIVGGQVQGEEAAAFGQGAPGIVPLMPKGRDAKPHTSLRVQANGLVLASPVFLDSERDEFFQRKILAHELGHCLGLAHDDSSDSVMYPEIANPLYIKLSRQDRKLLQRWYT